MHLPAKMNAILAHTGIIEQHLLNCKYPSELLVACYGSINPDVKGDDCNKKFKERSQMHWIIVLYNVSFVQGFIMYNCDYK